MNDATILMSEESSHTICLFAPLQAQLIQDTKDSIGESSMVSKRGPKPREQNIEGRRHPDHDTEEKQHHSPSYKWNLLLSSLLVNLLGQTFTEARIQQQPMSLCESYI